MHNRFGFCFGYSAGISQGLDQFELVHMLCAPDNPTLVHDEVLILAKN